MFIKNRRISARIILCLLMTISTFNTYSMNLNGLYNRTANVIHNIRNRCASLWNWPARQAQNKINKLENHVERRINNHIDAIGNRIENRINNASINVHYNLSNLIWTGVFGVATLVTTFYLTKYLWLNFIK